MNKASLSDNLKKNTGTSLMVQWLRSHLPMQGTQLRSLVWEGLTCREATKPVRHNHWACALEPARHSYWSPRATTTEACVPQQLSPPAATTEAHVTRARAPQWRVAPAHHNWRKPTPIKEDPKQPKINKI